MKTTRKNDTIHCALLAFLLAGLSVLNTYGQFNSGSDGSYGAMNITSNTTLTLPTNGIFNCTSINIGSGATLKFTLNALNTPVYLLATGDVVINGTIDVSGAPGSASWGGAGGPGGFSGGNPPSNDGYGPGAGRATNGYGGYASYGTAAYGNEGALANGATYGTAVLVPLVGGSGGGAATAIGVTRAAGGGGGGGAILIASSTTITLAGSIVAFGALGSDGYYHSSHFGAGSGGAIRLVAPVVSGSGSLQVSGASSGNGDGSGGGRTRIDCIDRSWIALGGVNSIGAYMVVFPTNAPHLNITQVAGNNIPVGTNSSVFFLLPENAPTNQTVIVQASNFSSQVPIRLVLTPDSGSSSFYDTNIDNSTINPASVTVPVVVPVNVRVVVNAWTR